MAQDETQQEKIEKKTKPPVSYYEAVGRRKVSNARVRLYVVGDDSVTVGGVTLQKGGMIVNGRPVENYFPGEVLKKISEPERLGC